MLNIIESFYDRDPVSLNIFWEIDENNNKKIVYPLDKINDIIYYYDNNNRLICLEKETLEYLKKYNINKHPLTYELFPLEIYNNIKCKKNIKETAYDIFQLLSKISVYINEKYFLELSHDKLLKFNYELRDFWLENFNDEQKLNIYNGIILDKKNEDLKNYSIQELQKYLLLEMEKLLKCNIEEYNFMISYIIICALSIVIPDIAIQYPGFRY